MSNTDFCSDALLDYLYTQTLPTPLPPDYTKDDFSKWQIKKRNEVQDLLRIQELSNLLSVPVSAQLIEQFYTDDVLIEKYCLQGIRHLNTPLYIAGANNPASKSILYLHGHDKFGIQGALKHLEASPYHKYLPLLLAKEGYRVYAPEMIGFGEAHKQHYDMGNSKEGSCFPNGTQLLASGFSLAGLRSFQAMKIVDFMKQQNAETISVFGISGGGMGAMYLSACDSRIDHMILSGYPCTWPDTLFVHHHCIDNFVPGMTRIADGPQIISLFAPKPLLLLTGKTDHVFALSGAQKAFSVVREAYQIFDCPHQLQSFVFDGGHEAAPELVIQWFRDRCK